MPQLDNGNDFYEDIQDVEAEYVDDVPPVNPTTPPNYQGGGYQPYYNQMPPQPPRQTDNAVGLTGFILSLVSLLPLPVPFLSIILMIAALVCSILGLQKEPNTLAKAGIIIVAVSFALSLLALMALASCAAGILGAAATSGAIY